jgi:hypothetical protein
MFIGYYKSVNSSKEFYSKKRSNLNFPIQIEYNSDRYLLNKTIQVFSDSQEKNLIDTARRYGIEYNIEIQSGMDD